MNKKALLPEEILKIVLAILSIIILIYLAVSLYGILTMKSKIDQAKSSLQEISQLKEGDDYMIQSPKDWYLISFFENNYKTGDCNQDKCLCLCSDVDLSGETVGKCYKEGGLCINSDFVVDNTNVVKVFQQQGESYEVKTANCLKLENLPITIKLDKGSLKVQNEKK